MRYRMNPYYAYVAYDKTNNRAKFGFSSDFLSDVLALGQAKAKNAADWRLYMWIGPFATRAGASRFAAQWRESARPAPLASGAWLAQRAGVSAYSFQIELKT